VSVGLFYRNINTFYDATHTPLHIDGYVECLCEDFCCFILLTTFIERDPGNGMVKLRKFYLFCVLIAPQ